MPVGPVGQSKIASEIHIVAQEHDALDFFGLGPDVQNIDRTCRLVTIGQGESQIRLDLDRVVAGFDDLGLCDDLEVRSFQIRCIRQNRNLNGLKRIVPVGVVVKRPRCCVVDDPV